MAHENGGARVCVMGEQLFYDDDGRPVLVHYLYYTIVQGAKSRGHVRCGPAFRAADDAGLADKGAPGRASTTA